MSSLHNCSILKVNRQIQLLQASTPTTPCSDEPKPSSGMQKFTASLSQSCFSTWSPTFLLVSYTLPQKIFCPHIFATITWSVFRNFIMFLSIVNKPGLSSSCSSFPKCSPTGSESFIPITINQANLIYPTAAQPDAAAPKNLSTASPRSSAASTLASSLPPRQKNLSLPLNGS